MAEESFKERARQEMIKAAKQYKDIYVDYEYLICSVIFEKNDYYIIAAEEDNFQHLTGVQSKIDAKTFSANVMMERLRKWTSKKSLNNGLKCRKPVFMRVSGIYFIKWIWFGSICGWSNVKELYIF